MKARSDEESIPVANIGHCPVGGCTERWEERDRLARLETKMWILMLGVGAVISELALLIYRGTP